ncbi:hypothetical protein DOY81_004729 [Sarcophaga bullata]|nr:hypothetical protein DOY81_004729 [Sarcophaga bullata]
MESTSDVVQLKEQSSSTLSSTVTKKCVQEVSGTSIREISSSQLQAKEGSGIVIEDPNKLFGNQISNNVIKLMYPDDANTANTTSLQNEFVAMAIKDEHGNDFRQLTQQNQEELSASVSTLDGGSTITSLTQLSSASSSSLAKEVATTSVVIEAQETSISSSSPKTVTDKNDRVNKHLAPKNESVQVEETITIKKRVEKVSEDVKEDQTNDEDGEAAEQVVTEQVTSIIEKEQIKSSSDGEEEIVEDSIDENGKSVSKSVTEKVAEYTIDSPNGKGTKTIKNTTVTQEIPNGTKTVVATTTITKEAPTTTTIITTPSTPTTEETFVKENKEVENEKSSKVEEKIVEEEEAEDEEAEDEEDDEDESEQEEEEEEAKEDDKLNENNEAAGTVVEEKEIPKKEQVQPPEPPQQSNFKEETIVDAPSSLINTNQLNINNKQDNINNTLKDIISSTDSNIIVEENIAALKEREIELIKKQQELAKEIQQQEIIAQKLTKNNRIKKEEVNNIFNSGNNESFVAQEAYQPINNVSKYSTYEENQDENIYTRKSETLETRESTNVSKKIDLHKIFTPATDAEEILPKNRKLYASSAFYSPTLHPTVEDQVELARRISHSLSDISNQQSRGQYMYVNRKKRSVKWVHEGCGQEVLNETTLEILNHDENKEEGNKNNVCHLEKVPLKFLMNPHGQMRDINSLRESLNTETGLLSPDVSVEVVTALQTHKGKGAELFAKRRKVSEKWVVDENNVGAQSPSGLPDYHQYQTQPKPSTSPSILPAYTDAAKHRVQLKLHQEQLMEKYAKSGLKVVQTPWEAALNSGSASTAFVEENNLSPYPTSILTPSPTPQIYDTNEGGAYQQSPTPVADIYNKPSAKDDYNVYQPKTESYHLPQVQSERQQYSCTNSQRELAYKPSIPQGWKAPGMSLPKDLYMPKEIPVQSYAPPPAMAIPASVSPFSSNADYEIKQSYVNKSTNASFPAPYLSPESLEKTKKSFGGSNTFPIHKPYQQGFSSIFGHTQSPKQQYLSPQSYRTVPQNSSHNLPQVNFNPSPLPYDKLAKFENPSTDNSRHAISPNRNYHLNIREIIIYCTLFTFIP